MESLGGDGMSLSVLSTAHTNTFRLFMLEGIVTFVVAIFGFWLLPDTPKTTRWLTEEERELAHGRMVRDQVSMGDSDVSAVEGLKQACKDYKTWIFVLMQCFHLSACSFNSFFPTYVPGSPSSESSLTIVVSSKLLDSAPQSLL